MRTRQMPLAHRMESSEFDARNACSVLVPDHALAHTRKASCVVEHHLRLRGRGGAWIVGPRVDWDECDLSGFASRLRAHGVGSGEKLFFLHLVTGAICFVTMCFGFIFTFEAERTSLGSFWGWGRENAWVVLHFPVSATATAAATAPSIAVAVAAGYRRRDSRSKLAHACHGQAMLNEYGQLPIFEDAIDVSRFSLRNCSE